MKLVVSLPLLLIGMMTLLSGFVAWPSLQVVEHVRILFLVTCATALLISAALARR